MPSNIIPAETNGIRDKAAIVGIGETEFSWNSGRSELLPSDNNGRRTNAISTQQQFAKIRLALFHEVRLRFFHPIVQAIRRIRFDDGLCPRMHQAEAGISLKQRHFAGQIVGQHHIILVKDTYILAPRQSGRHIPVARNTPLVRVLIEAQAGVGTRLENLQRAVA